MQKVDKLTFIHWISYNDGDGDERGRWRALVSKDLAKKKMFFGVSILFGVAFIFWLFVGFWPIPHIDV